MTARLLARALAGFLASGVALWMSSGSLTAQAPRARTATAGALIDFDAQIRPLITERCLECHSQDKRKGGLSLATWADVLDGGRSGPAVRPGNSRNSLLIHRVRGDVEPQMPKDEDPLRPADLALLRRWIDQGARETRTGPPAPAPWEAPLGLEPPVVPAPAWAAWSAPIDRFVSVYLRDRKVDEPALVSDAVYARRVYLDVWGLLPTPEQLDTFVSDPSPGKRAALVATLLADNGRYSEHWISFWNDLLRNEDGVTYFSETAGRKPITDWLLSALESNLPYDTFIRKLLSPTAPGDPDGFLVGVNWRGETSAAVTPWMQASQNTSQVFLGINLKCNACHDSFVSRWKLKDAYALAAYFAPEPKLQLFRCDVALSRYAEPAFLYPQVSHTPASGSLADRRAAAAALFTDRRVGRMPRTLVNRLWHRLFGVGIVSNPDEMDGKPWSPALLDWVASDFVEHRYDVKHVLQGLLTSRAYQMAAVSRGGEPPARGYLFDGPEVRRLTAEQFGDAIGSLTGEWNVYPGRPSSAPSPPPPAPAAGSPLPSMPSTAGVYGREWRVASSNLSRALGRPIRDQVIPVRAAHASTLQAMELVNGEILTKWLARGARRLLGEPLPEPRSLYNRTVAGRGAKPAPFVVDISKATRLWLVVQENGSNMPKALMPAWARAELVGPSGAVPLSSLKAMDESGLRSGAGPIRVDGTEGEGVRVKNPSVLEFDIAGRGFTTLRGVIGLENPAAEIGSTLDPQIRFFVFDTPPNMDRLIPPGPGLPMPAPPPPALASGAAAIDRVFRHALGRLPSPAERAAAEQALRDPARGDRPSPEGLADLLWAITMKPEFQLIY